SGVPLERLGVGQGPLDEAASRAAWRTLCEHWHVFRGTPVRYWLESELAEIFEVSVRPSARTADDIYDHLAERLARPEFRPRALFERFGISVLATTDDPVDDLAAHAALAADPSFRGRVIPTFRPDRYLEPARPGWVAAVDRLGEVADVDVSTYAGWVEAIERRREFFASRGAVSTDHSHDDVGSHPLDATEAERTGAAARAREPARPGWVAAVDRLGEVADVDVSTCAGWVEAIERRREFFASRGAVSTDHSHDDVGSHPLEATEAERIYAAARAGEVSEAEGTALRRHMFLEMARMATEDGLAITVHPGVRRAHHGPTAERFGPDTGPDIPIAGEFTDSLRP